MTEHDERAQELERELDEMEERTDRLEDETSEAREDWERKKADAGVPGAVGEPDEGVDTPEIDPRDPADEDL
jgi:predicted nuclease with TOPRIM domain